MLGDHVREKSSEIPVGAGGLKGELIGSDETDDPHAFRDSAAVQFDERANVDAFGLLLHEDSPIINKD